NLRGSDDLGGDSISERARRLGFLSVHRFAGELFFLYPPDREIEGVRHLNLFRRADAQLLEATRAREHFRLQRSDETIVAVSRVLDVAAHILQMFHHRREPIVELAADQLNLFRASSELLLLPA